MIEFKSLRAGLHKHLRACRYLKKWKGICTVSRSFWERAPSFFQLTKKKEFPQLFLDSAIGPGCFSGRKTGQRNT